MATAGNITAVLTLNATQFKTGLDSALSAVANFKKDSASVSNTILSLEKNLASATSVINRFNVDASKLKQFSTYAKGINDLANGLVKLSKESVTSSQGMKTISNILNQFNSNLVKTEVQLNLTNTQIRELNNSANGTKSSVKSMGTSFESVRESLLKLGQGALAFNRIDSQSNAVKESMAMMKRESDLAFESLLKIGQGVLAFNRIDTGIKQVNTSLDSAISKINSYRNAFYGLNSTLSSSGSALNSFSNANSLASQRQAYVSSAVNSTNNNLRTQTSTIQSLTPNIGQMTSQYNNLSVASTSTANSTNTLSTSQTQLGKSSQSASAGMNRASSSAKGLRNSMITLKNAVSLVGSMIAYNFLHRMGQAVNETINAKSEMEGYFKMLGFGRSQVNSFNSALDKTVAQFQRVNKYSLGETISSIGVEFNLTTKEMEKAMKVTSMITSEYLRAGRNANEASLAVKDVLQGQFQRLSRETGVKGEQLKEAGWSGDTNDVMGLMKALEKVGKDRNWDVFASKANSLNDIVTILQNRFGEWSADMVNKVQPAIVSAFNTLMSVGSHFGAVFSKITDWLGQEGWGQTAVQIAGVTTALGVGYGALVSYRTGANLVQIAQMGLKDSIIATIFGLEAQTVADNDAYKALVMRATGLDATTVKEIGRTKALMSAVIGLDMATVKEYGFKNALLSSLSGVKASEIATKGLSVSLRGLATSFALPMAVIIPFGVALGGLAMDIMNTTSKMDKFYKVLENGDEIVNNAKDAVSSLKGRLKELQTTQSKYAEGSQEYINTGKAIEQVNKDIALATDKVGEAEEAVNMARRAEENYNAAKLEKRLDMERQINSALVDVGVSTETARQLSSDYLRDAINGSAKLYETLQKVNLQYQKTATAVAMHTQALKDAGYTDEEIELKIKPLIESGVAIADAKEELGQSRSISEYVDKWLWLQVQEIQHTITETSLKMDEAFKATGGDFAKALGSGLQNLVWGAINGLGDLPVGQWVQNWFNENMPELKGAGKKWFLDILMSPFASLFHLDEIGKISEKILEGFNHIKDEFLKAWGDILSFDWLPTGEDAGNGLQKIDTSWLFDLIFSNIDIDGISEYFNTHLIQPISEWWTNFTTDPLSFLGIDSSAFGMGQLLNTLLGAGEDMVSNVWTWFNNSFVLPLQQVWTEFSSNPLAYLGGLVIDFATFLNGIFGTDVFTSVTLWVYNSIITPFGSALYNGIMSIPIVGDILSLFGLVTDEGTGANRKGQDLGKWIGNGITTAIGQIPIVGDILRMLGLIPQTNGDAHSKGHGVGENIKDGEKQGHTGMADNVVAEMGRVVNAVAQKAGEAFQAAYDVGAKIVEGIKSAMHINSPGILATDIIPTEFGVNIPNAITSNADMAYSSAQYYGQQMVDGVSSVSTTGVGLGNMVGEYESDAQTIAMSSQLMGTETTLAFNNMQMAVNSTTNSMVGNVNSSYTSMQQKQTTSLNSMKQNNLQAYNDMYLKSNQSLLQMRTSTENVTNQMVHAWSHMKNQIVATANRLKAESTSHFNQLSNTIGSFYRKIQNPSSWGSAGGGSRMNVRGARHPSAGKNFTNSIKTRTSTGHYAGGYSPYETKNKTMSLRQLKSMICPNGSCDLFDGYDLSQKVNVNDFLSKIEGEHGFGSWSNWDRTHYNYIKNKSDQWSMKSPTINLKGGIPTNANYKVGDFENGTPKISFGSFESMAESIFRAIPYKFYFDSSWKGSWLGALQAGACNCWDGANALIAFANTCGFGGHIAHGSWNGVPHVWAVINGRKMDTTGMQQRGTWTPSASAGGLPSKRYAGGDTGKTVNVTVDMSNSTIYGVEDLDERIEQGVKKGMQQEFNDSFAVTL